MKQHKRSEPSWKKAARGLIGYVLDQRDGVPVLAWTDLERAGGFFPKYRGSLASDKNLPIFPLTCYLRGMKGQPLTARDGQEILILCARANVTAPQWAAELVVKAREDRLEGKGPSLDHVYGVKGVGKRNCPAILKQRQDHRLNCICQLMHNLTLMTDPGTGKHVSDKSAAWRVSGRLDGEELDGDPLPFENAKEYETKETEGTREEKSTRERVCSQPEKQFREWKRQHRYLLAYHHIMVKTRPYDENLSLLERYPDDAFTPR